MIKKLLVFCLSTSICACVSQYVPPTPGQPYATIFFQQSGAYDLIIFENGENCSSKRAVPKESSPFQNGNAPLKILANKEIAFISASAYGGYPIVTSCKIILSFTPKANQQYKYSFERVQGGCSANILKLSESGIYEKESSTKQRVFVMPALESGSFCEPSPRSSD